MLTGTGGFEKKALEQTLQRPRKHPLLQQGKQRTLRGQGAAVGGFEGFDGGDAGVGQTQVAAPPSASKAATSARNCGKSA